ncbi:hypothetical protein BATDEDRAFT_22392 [Batrachochytrium dendrobatidis JAM81]|uniref:Uncharacterized protein n=1 Tax=Batrachochytrium dendrobatidis (strain JAM81 / FGSC 10211) TaxID=684364 RepID=F4NU68_BATDJ|nr:uncharacterized protein BATDEDRAFT_22392 [Batrachochytrium dendrobatidis JAM81]EGF84389.1 hypothetical protein BATDEDRAFT_22392 [Batrachochytrium dendrobatidis JAM81]|eukprot:XP_006675556.1 hypothetical protein BATDEDRAFT_22392 [Batrachochytrium dendrobatidis JAM81]
MSTIVHSKMQVVITWYAKNIITAVLNDTIGITSHRIVEWNGVMVVVCVAPPGMSRAAANVISKRSSILSGQCYHVKSSIWLNDTVDVYVPEHSCVSVYDPLNAAYIPPTEHCNPIIGIYAEL